MGVVLTTIIFIVVVIINFSLAESLEDNLGISYKLANVILYALEIVIAIVIGVIYFKNQDKKQNEKKQKQLAVQKQKMFEDNSLLIYKKCVEKQIFSIDTEAQMNNLMIIAANYSVNDAELAKKSFEKGKELYKIEQQSNMNKQRAADKKFVDEMYQKALISGKEKYTHKLKSQIANKQVMAGLSEISAISSQRCMNNQREKDWAIAGGIANGIAGPAAGIATAMQVQNDNEASRKNKEVYRNNVIEARANKYKYEREGSDLQRQLDILENKLCDETNIESKFKLFRFSNFNASYSYGGGKNISVRFDVSAPQTVSIIDSAAVIDGSIKINVMDKNGESIGLGYYCAPGFDETDLSKVGFSNCKYPQALCYINDPNKEYNLSELKFSVEPVKLWYIEK